MEYILVSILSTLIGLAILYGIILTSVRTALTQHYKMVRRFEATGEWLRPWGRWTDAPEALDGSEDPEEMEQMEEPKERKEPW